MTGPSDKFIRLMRDPQLAEAALKVERWKFVRLPKPEGVVEIVTYRGAGR